MSQTQAQKLAAKPTGEQVKVAAAAVEETAQGIADAGAEWLRSGGLEAEILAGRPVGQQQDRAAIRSLAKEITSMNLEHKSYAYRFEVLDDGSVLAVYVTKAGEDAQYAAFEDMDATRGWHPTHAPEFAGGAAEDTEE